MKQKKKNLLFAAGILVLTALTLAFSVEDSASAEEGGGRAGEIQSKGIVNYADGSVVIDTGDLTRLAGEIDTLEQTYKTETQAALNGISTYIRTDGSVTHADPGEQTALPSFGQLKEAIQGSQSSATGIADLSGDSYFKSGDGVLQKGSEGGSGEQIELAAATADDLSAGKIAYVDGRLLLGTGADNAAYYKEGKESSTIIQRVLALIYHHKESLENYTIRDTSGHGYKSSASGEHKGEYEGTYISGKTDLIPLYNFSDDDVGSTKLLYKITLNYTIEGETHSSRDSYDCPYPRGYIYLRDKNGNEICHAQPIGAQPQESEVSPKTIVFTLTDYNTNTDAVYLEYNFCAVINISSNDEGYVKTAYRIDPQLVCTYYTPI